MPVEDRSAETRQHLLEAAGEVFAECSFRSATIRTICRRARANVAADHYHFGDKSTLTDLAVETYGYQLALRDLERVTGEFQQPRVEKVKQP